MKLELSKMEAMALEAELKLGIESWAEVQSDDPIEIEMDKAHIEDLKRILKRLSSRI